MKINFSVVVANYAPTVLLIKKKIPKLLRFFWLCFLIGYTCSLQTFLPLETLVNKLWVTKKSNLCFKWTCTLSLTGSPDGRKHPCRCFRVGKVLLGLQHPVPPSGCSTVTLQVTQLWLLHKHTARRKDGPFRDTFHSAADFPESLSANLPHPYIQARGERLGLADRDLSPRSFPECLHGVPIPRVLWK